MNFIERQDIRFDPDELRRETAVAVSRWGWNNNHQLGLSHRFGTMDTKERIHGECVRSGFRGSQKILEDLEISEFNPEFAGTYFDTVWDGMFRWSQIKYGYGICRMRLMMLPPMKCLSFHRDFEDRFHIAIDTNPYAFMLYGGQNYDIDDDGRVEPQLESYHIPDDGYVYRLDGYKRHSAMNGHGSLERIHLVMSLAVTENASRR